MAHSEMFHKPDIFTASLTSPYLSRAIKMSIVDTRLLDSEFPKDTHILVVDSHDDSLYLCALLLEGHSTKITAIDSVKGALSFLDKYIPDLLICEIRFPGENVYPLIQKVRWLAFMCCKPIPVLVTSAYPAALLAQRPKIQVEAYLLKPFDVNHLIDTALQLINLSKQPSSVPVASAC